MSIIPLISSDLAGPLGAIHLPRLWCKLLLSAKGQLPEDYAQCGGGFDQMTLDGLKVDRDAAIAFVEGNTPTYAQSEAWVLEQRGGNILAAEIEASNAAIRGYNHDDRTRGEILGAAGIADDGSLLDAVNLNNQDDWTALHNAVK